MSQLIASSLPPPSAKPLTAAMTGMGKLSIIRNTSLPSLPKASPSALVMVLMEPMSAPATKLLSPSPVRTIQRMADWSTASKAAFRSARTSGFRAFSAFGRSMVIISTAPCTSVFTNAIVKTSIQVISYSKQPPDKGQVSGLAHCPGCINIRSDPSKGNQSISTMVAQPMPPPMHRVARPL